MKNQIEEKKNEMLGIARKYGIESEETLKISKELDKLILIYQKQINQDWYLIASVMAKILRDPLQFNYNIYHICNQ